MGLYRRDRNEEERGASSYNLQCKRLDSARADWSVMLTYSDFPAGCCTHFPFVPRLAEKLTRRKFPGPGPDSPGITMLAREKSGGEERGLNRALN